MNHIEHPPRIVRLVEQHDAIDPDDLGRDKQIEYELVQDEAERRRREARTGRRWPPTGGDSRDAA